MNQEPLATAQDLAAHQIKIHEPFAKFLMSDSEEFDFTISLLDVVHFAGHACPAMVGAFFISQRAVQELFPETKTCIRGRVAIDIPSSVEQGATGPISNVFSMIFGSWEKSGFGGLKGNFVRRGLLRYNADDVPQGVFRFRDLRTKAFVDISYDPSQAQIFADPAETPFQRIWRMKIKKIMSEPDHFITAQLH
jgi:hypothetical protein